MIVGQVGQVGEHAPVMLQAVAAIERIADVPRTELQGIYLIRHRRHGAHETPPQTVGFPRCELAEQISGHRARSLSGMRDLRQFWHVGELDITSVSRTGMPHTVRVLSYCAS